MTALDLFPPAREAALARLRDFVPRAGRDYARLRNFDLGPGHHPHVSTLSPYLRCRMLTESEVLGAVLDRHSPEAAEKFVQEVFWRAYWKGWLEMRPSVWMGYRAQVTRDLDDVQTQSGLRARWEAACRGETGIACFDHWARELVSTGYLHNHARMWVASIWIFTLRLPWALGADFFLRHLLDGDPASNTLNWRWVAGLQTRGKTYLARPENIARYTEGRFEPQGELAEEAVPLDGPENPPAGDLPEPALADPKARTGLLLTTDDLSPGFALEGLAVETHARLVTSERVSPLTPAPHLRRFAEAALQDCVARHADRLGEPGPLTVDPGRIVDWAREADLGQIVTPYAPVGPTAEALDELARDLPEDIRVVRVRRGYDSRAWPHATKGFFKFKDRIPDLLAALDLPRAA